MSREAGGTRAKSTEVKAEPATKLSWDIGTAYDFFISLEVLHNPEDFGLRASWAAGVRSRLPVAERKLLEDVHHFLWLPVHWILTLPAPKDAAGVLWALRQIPPAERPRVLTNPHETPAEVYATFGKIAETRRWENRDLEIFRKVLQGHKKRHLVKDLTVYLDWWTRPDELGDLFLSALQSYYQAFFAEEEKRIAPVLHKSLAEARELAERMDLPDLLVELSQGVHFEQPFDVSEIVLIPGYWNTPIVIYPSIGKGRMAFIFGARPEDMSLIPGEQVPEGLLRVLKALADPTRMGILRYLSQEKLTPAQLSRRLRLRAPTVTHHLSALRLAGLVHVIVDADGEKVYAARLGAVESAFGSLEGYLSNEQNNEEEE